MTEPKSSSDCTRLESVVPQIELWARMHPAADPGKARVYWRCSTEGSFDESADGCLLPVIEEGIADGSIACKCPALKRLRPFVVGESLAAAAVPSARDQGSNARSRAMFGADGGRGGARFG